MASTDLGVRASVPPAEASTRRRRFEGVPVLFSATILVSSGLLFLVQPLVAKMVLPRFGGVPAVWTTSMVFFQAALLAGYLYAHVSIRRLGARRQVLVHLPVLLATVTFLPLAVRSGGTPGSPVLGVLVLLAASVGLPFFTVATSGPLLQRWLGASGHPSGRDPYFLYAISNLGSMLGLVAYPLVLEPAMALEQQARVWSIGFGVLLALTAACAVVVRRGREAEGQGSSRDFVFVGEAEPVTARRRFRWIGLAFVPSSLMLGVTSHFSTDVAPVPLLWVLPLALYLVTFILTFANRVRIPHRAMVRALPFAMVPLVMLIGLHAGRPAWIVGVVHLGVFFVAAMVCHGELAADRPAPERLTEFYLLVSVGGVLGGIVNAIVAPLVFDAILEYPLALVAACLCLRPSAGRPAAGARTRMLDVALPAAVAAFVVLVGGRVGGGQLSSLERVLLFGVPAIVVFAFRARSVRFALGIAAMLTAGSFNPETPGRELFRDRTFFGVQTVVRSPDGINLFKHGNTVHGAQVPGSLEALTYYHSGSPIADVFASGRPRRSVAAIGLGAGTIACYGRSGESWRFYEIDPVVAAVARDPRFFTFLRDCPPARTLDVVLGDARLSMAAERGTRYDLVVVDAFNSDAIPVHLMTREALALYLEHLERGGMVAFHISHRYLNLSPVMAALAKDAGLVARVRGDAVPAEEFLREKRPSIWVVMARDEVSLGRLGTDPRWEHLSAPAGRPVWTDGYSNVLGTFRWR